MNNSYNIIIVGAGIVGVSTALWLLRSGHSVTIIDKNKPGNGTSFGNAGILARSSVAPVTAPGLLSKVPKMLLDPNFPLFLRWSYLPKLMPWMVKYLSYANDLDTGRIAEGLAFLTRDSVRQHVDLVKNTGAETWLKKSDYAIAYTSRSVFDADAYAWNLRAKAGFYPELIEGNTVRDVEPMLSKKIQFLALMSEHGFIRDPASYIKSIVEEVKKLGGKILKSEVLDFNLTDGKIKNIVTNLGNVKCDRLVLAAGIWSKQLLKKLGLNVPMESERGYHIEFKSPSQELKLPIMVASGKFVATSMKNGLRCAGIVEFGGLEALASSKPLKLLERKVEQTFPDLKFKKIEPWLGHRPTLSDSLPIIGEIKNSNVFGAFGHHHIGLTAGPKTGRLIADLITKGGINKDIHAYSPNRF